jgi:PAS domain S-box-containing protein
MQSPQITGAGNLPERKSLIMAGLVFLALYTAWLLWGRSGPWERLLVGNLVMVFTGLVALVTAWKARSQQSQPRLRSAWSWLVAGLVLWPLGDLLRMAYQILAPALVYHITLLDAVYLLGSIAFWMGLLVYPRLPRLVFGRLVLLFDAGLTAAAALTMVWLIVLKPAVASLPGQGGGNPLAVLYPLADLISLILLMSLFLVADVRHLPAPFGWISLGLMAYTISDLAYASLLVGGQYQTGNPIDLGWVLGDGLITLAALSQLRTSKADQQSFQWVKSKLIPRLQALLPLLTTLVLGWYALLTWQLHGQPDQLGLWVTVVLGLGLVARQGIITGEIELQKYASLVNSVAEPAFVCDNRGRLRLMNPALLETAGYANLQELLGYSLENLVQIPAGTIGLLSQGLSRGWSGELALHRRDGSSIPVYLSLRLLKPSGSDRLALAGTAHDLSDQKRQQAALQAAYEQIASDRTMLEQLNVQLEEKVVEKTASLSQAYSQLEQQHKALQELDQLKSDFISMVSHELRAPLTNINGGIELLLAGKYPVSDGVRQNLTLVQAEIERLTRFVETILDLSALDAGRAPLYPAPASLHPITETLCQQMSHREGAERVCWDVPEDLPPLLADEQALTSVLFHLLDNALKYAPQGAITVSAGAQDGQAWIKVTDEGPGIPAEALPLIFDRFYRLNSADSQMIYGHGLGLYIVKRLLEAMHGEISAENRPQGGACFTCWLPLVEEKEEENALQDPDR